MSDDAAMIRRLSRTIASLVNRIEDLDRRFANFERPGKVIDTDYEKGLVKVKAGDLDSHWVPWRTRAGDQLNWDPPAKGEQVVLRSPSGEPGQGYCDHGGYSDQFPQNHNKGGEWRYSIGDSYILMTGEQIILHAAKVGVDADTTIGGKPGAGVPCSKQGTVDTGGYADVSSLANRVRIV